MSPESLPPRTRQAFDFIKNEVEAGHPFPKREAIAFHMGWKGTGGVDDTLMRLMDYGFIKRSAADKRVRARWIWSLAE